MKDVIKDTSLDIAGLPKGVVSRVEKFGDTYITVVAEKAFVDGRRFHLPGSMELTDNNGNKFNIFGIKTPDFKILIVLDKTIDLVKGITKEDISYFKDLENFSIACNLRNLDLEPEDVFRPIESLINSTPVNSDSSFVEFKSPVNGKSVFVKKGSNRHKFINGESDFFDDPFDFYDVRDMSIRLDNIEHYAASKGTNAYVYMFDKLESNPIGACLTIFSNPNMKEVARNAIRIRETVTSKFKEENYWNDFVENPPRLATYKDIAWDKVEKALSVSKNNEDSFNAVVENLAVEAESSSWGPYTVHVFFMFYLLLEQNKVNFIKNSFNL